MEGKDRIAEKLMSSPKVDAKVCNKSGFNSLHLASMTGRNK